MIYSLGLPLCSVYCNTVLANLNAGAYFRGEALPHNTDTDWFTTSGSLAFTSTKGDNQGEEATMVPSAPHVGFPISTIIGLSDDAFAVGYLEYTTEVVAFPLTVPKRSTTLENP